MILKERLNRLVQVIEESSETELRLLVELLEEKMAEKPVALTAKEKLKRNFSKHSEYSKAQIVKAFELRKKGFTQKLVAEKTGIREGCLRNPNWLKDSYKRVGK